MKRFIVFSLLILGPSLIAMGEEYPYPPAYDGGVESGGYDHASTVQQGSSQGAADVLRSNGANNWMSSTALKNIEDARAKNIENRQHAMQAYYQFKEANQEYRDAQRRQPPTSDEMERINASRRPERLSSNQVDPQQGIIRWPLALRGEEFALERARIEELYLQRVRRGDVRPEDYLEVRKLTGDMLADLQRRSDRLPGNTRIDARKLLEGIAYEARLEAASPGLAGGTRTPGPAFAKVD